MDHYSKNDNFIGNHNAVEWLPRVKLILTNLEKLNML